LQPFSLARSQVEPIPRRHDAAAMLQISQSDLPLTLSAGAVHAELTATSLSAVYSDGASAFAQLALSNMAGGKKGDAVEVLLQAEGARSSASPARRTTRSGTARRGGCCSKASARASTASF